MKRTIVIFTDLDGSLLDHEDYSFEGALPALARIKGAGIPLIFTTSKTRNEIEDLQSELGIRDPFIVENGAAVFFPTGYRDFRMDKAAQMPPYLAMVLGRPYGEIRRFFDGLKRRFPVRGFGDLSADEVSRLAGLPFKKALWAKARDFTEPFIIEDPGCLGEIEERAGLAGLKVTRGGRFHHLMGADQDKGAAVRLTERIFAANRPGGVISVGLGDSPNDLPMLESVDIPVMIPRIGGKDLDTGLPRLRKARYPGSRGWNESVLEVLDELQGNPH